jgi:hypothetical protein
MLHLFKKDNGGSPERFWRWFAENAAAYKAFITRNDGDMRPYHKLIAAMQKVDKRVSPELTVENDGTNVLVITCDGIKEAADAVISLAEGAPDLPGWRVQRFRPPGDPEGMVIKLAALELGPADMRVAYHVAKDENKVHVALFINGYKEDETEFKQIAFLLLDHCIGEYNTMMHLGAIEFHERAEAQPELELLSLDELRQLIERECY